MIPAPNLLLESISIKPQNEDIFKILAEFKDFAIFFTDPDGCILRWNKGAEKIFGYNGDEMSGKHISLLYTIEDVENGVPAHNLSQAIKNGRHEHEELKYRKDSTAFYAHTVLNVLHNEAGEISGFVKITNDITHQKTLEEENKRLTDQLEEKVSQRTRDLEVANNELEAFSYSVSHDLRAPLRAIGGYSAMLKEEYGSSLDAEANRIINVVIDNSTMMGQLIDDLLTFSKMSRLTVSTREIDMKALTEKCIEELLQLKMYGHPVIVVRDIPPSSGDENMLKQVWINLLGNAIKYSSNKADPQIEVGSVPDEKNNVYYVKDNGAGFDMKYAANLFGVFQRLHRQDEFEGTGLGLALAKRIISKHHGEMWAQSVLKEGAAFYFSIPKNEGNG